MCLGAVGFPDLVGGGIETGGQRGGTVRAPAVLVNGSHGDQSWRRRYCENVEGVVSQAGIECM